MFKNIYLTCKIIIVCFNIIIVNHGFSCIETIETTIVNVGQGNCIINRFIDKDGQTKIHLNDLGTCSFNNESNYVYLNKIQKQHNDVLDESTTEFSSFKDIIDDEHCLDRVDNEKKLVKKIRNFLVLSKTSKDIKNSLLNIYRIDISHSDTDHYNKLIKVIHNPKDKVGSLVFGGLPEHYNFCKDDDSKEWLNYRFKNETKVYFPAIQLEPITTMQQFDDVLKKSRNEHYIKHIYTTIDGQLSDLRLCSNILKDAHFGDNVRMDYLCINSRHLQGPNNILRIASPKNDNDDSLVIKITLYERSIKGLSWAEIIKLKSRSILLPGDMTGITEKVIKDSFLNHPQMCQADVMVLAHHGSNEEGCNSQSLLSMVKPKIVISSNGYTRHNHLNGKTYQYVHELESLRSISFHSVHSALKNEYFLNTTQGAILSTLDSGDIKVTFTCSDITANKDMPLHTEKNGNITYLPQTERLIKTADCPDISPIRNSAKNPSTFRIGKSNAVVKNSDVNKLRPIRILFKKNVTLTPNNKVQENKTHVISQVIITPRSSKPSRSAKNTIRYDPENYKGRNSKK